MLSHLFNGLVDILYPKKCLACGQWLKGGGHKAIKGLVCLDCWMKIKPNLPPFCASCGRHLDKKSAFKNICGACAKNRFHFDRAFSPCLYEGVLKELIHKFKYKQKDYLGNVLGLLMAEFVKEYNLPVCYADLIIPIPLHKTRLREREFNQAGILANLLSAEFGRITLSGCLVREKFFKSQTELSVPERRNNIKGAFAVKDRAAITGKNILLVDDVLTTGATLSEAAKTLKESGANIVFAITLAN